MFFLVGNKVDLDAKGLRQIDRSEAKAWGKENDVERCYETNAHDQKHILDLFNVIKTDLIADFKTKNEPRVVSLVNEIK